MSATDKQFGNMVKQFLSEAKHYQSTGQQSAGLNIVAAMSPQYAGAIKRALEKGDEKDAEDLVKTVLGKLIEMGPVKYKVKVKSDRRTIKVQKPEARA